tara:strand:- start:299 stop:403 length:105 start_codon:yes stop_codon:yes gene_type:complete
MNDKGKMSSGDGEDYFVVVIALAFVALSITFLPL